MTTKLPEVGKIYRLKKGQLRTVEVLAVAKGIVFFEKIITGDEASFSKYDNCCLFDFNNLYEAANLLEDKAETKLETQSPVVGKRYKLRKTGQEFVAIPVEAEVRMCCQDVSQDMRIKFEHLTTLFEELPDQPTEEKEFFYGEVGMLIEYQGKRYICLQSTNYLPNERPEDWKESDYTSEEYQHTKIKFRDLFANNKPHNLKKEGEVQIKEPVASESTPSEVDKALEELKDALINNVTAFNLYEKAKDLVDALEAERISKREEQTNSLRDALYDLKGEVEQLQQGDDLKINPQSMVEDMLQKKLARLMDKASEVISAAGMSKPEPKIDMKEGSVDPVKSIWKPVSEVAFWERQDHRLLYKHENGQIAVSSKPNTRDGLIKEICTLTDYINNIEERLTKLEEKK